MTSNTVKVGAALLACASVASASPDLTVTDWAITNVITTPTLITFEYELLVTNIGDMPIDLFGTDPGPADDVVIQSFLSDTPDASGVLEASGGANFGLDPIDLGPGDDALFVFGANTNNLPDPGELGNFQWLVFDILNTTEGTSELGNNRLIIQIPAPGVATIGAFAGMGLCRRRRR